MVREFGQIRAEIGLPFRRHGFQTFGDATGNTALSVDRRPSHAHVPCRIARLAPRRTPSPPHAVRRVRRSGLSNRLHQAEPHPASTPAHPRWASTGTTTERASSAITKSRPCISARARAIVATLRRPRGDTPKPHALRVTGLRGQRHDIRRHLRRQRHPAACRTDITAPFDRANLPQPVGMPVHADLPLAHGLQHGGLRLRIRTVDLVGDDDWRTTVPDGNRTNRWPANTR